MYVNNFTLQLHLLASFWFSILKEPLNVGCLGYFKALIDILVGALPNESESIDPLLTGLEVALGYWDFIIFTWIGEQTSLLALDSFFGFQWEPRTGAFDSCSSETSSPRNCQLKTSRCSNSFSSILSSEYPFLLFHLPVLFLITWSDFEFSFETNKTTIFCQNQSNFATSIKKSTLCLCLIFMGSMLISHESFDLYH